MKKFDTFQTFARGAKSLVAILLVMLMAVGGLFAQTTYNFSDYSSGDQYAEEEHVLDGVLTIYTVECHFRTDGLRIYSSDAHNGYFYSNALPNNIDSISFNIGNATDKLLVYGSADGMTWTLIGSVASVSTYSNQGIGFGDNEYNYFKCDVEGSNQLRIKSFTMFYKTTPTVEIPTWVTEDQVAIFNTQVNGLVPTFSVNDNNESVFHFAYTDAFQGYPAQNPSTEMGANPSKVYVDVMIKRPNTEITGVKVSYGEGHDTIINFTEVTDPYNGTLGDPYDAILHYFPVATVFTDGTTVGNPIDRSWTVDVEWCIGTNVVDTQYVIVKVDAAPGDNWVTCEQVDVFNTQVDGLVPTCSTVGDSTVFHFAYTDAFNGFPEQTPNQEMGGNPAKVYVDVRISRPNDDITGVKVSYGPGHEEIINFTEVTDPNNGTLGHPYDAVLAYFPVATVNADGSVTGNTVDRNWTIDVEWCVNQSVVCIQKLNVMVDAAPAPVLPYDTVAELPYVNNFDEGIDPYFVIENGTATNKWYTGQVEGFDNNKLYISSNGGTTNKYDINKASNVIAYRDVMVPEIGAALSFDYRVNGEGTSTLYDYLEVELEKEGTSTEVAMLNLQNDWNSFNYNIPAEMAGVVRVVFIWRNDNSVGNQFPAAIDNISIIATPCVQPANLLATVDTTTATITWEAVEGQSVWNFEYKLADHTDWYTMAVSDTTVTLSDLQGNSIYEMRVQAVCDELTSEWTVGIFEVECQHEVEGICEDQIACPNPTELVVENVTFNSAELSWTAGAENQTAFLVEYMAEGDVDWTSVNVNDTIYTLTELAQLTNYTVRVKANCGEYNLSEAITASFTTEGMCPNITNLQFSNMSNTTTLTWEAGGEETAWLVQFKPETASEDEWISINVSIVPMTTFGGLQGNTHYVARVKALCDPENEENQSEWVNLAFTSGCSPYDVPFEETFGAYSLPTCWAGEGFDFYSGYTRSYYEEDYLISPSVSIPAENTTYLIFEVSGSSNYTVLASYRGTREDRFEEIYNGTATSATQKVIVPISSIYMGRATNFKFVNNGSNLRINYVKVNQCPFEVTAFTASNTSNEVELTWTADEAITSFQIQYGEQGFTPEEGIIVDVENANTYTIGDLNYETTYEFYIRVVCEGDNGAWVGPRTITTPCMPFSLDEPFFEGFEGTDFAPECWMNYHVEGPGTLLWKRNISTSYIHQGSASAQLPDMRKTTYTNLVSPAFVIPTANAYRVSVWVYRNTSGTSYPNEGVKVWANTVPEVDDNAVELFHAHRSISYEPVQTSQGWYEYVAPIPMTGNVYIIFEGICEYGSSTYIDDITVDLIPTCDVPQNLAFNGTTSTLTWEKGVWGATPASYNIRYGLNGENTYEEITSDTTFVTLSGLLSNTEYVFSVQAVCGNDDNSEWSESITATTPCLPLSLPYIEDFNSYTTSSTSSSAPSGYPNQTMPECWNFLNMSSSSSTYPQMFLSSISDYAVSGNCLFFRSSNSTPAYAVLPQFDEDLNNLMIKFTYRNEGTSASNGTIYLGYMTNPNDPSTFVSVDTCNRITTKTEIEFLFNQLNIAGSNYHIAFRYTGGTSNNYYAAIDNISVTRIPTCFVPSITVNGTNVTITSNANGDEAQSYNLKIGEVTINTTSTTVDLNTLFTLEANTDYEISVQSVCGEGNESEWSDAVTFRTPCMPFSLDEPFFEGFEGIDFAPECWMNYHVEGPGTQLWQRNTSSYYIHEGSASAKLPDMSSTTYTNLVSPAFIIPTANAYRVSVWVYRNATGTSKPNEGVKVWANTVPEVDDNAVELFHAHRYIGFEPVQTSTGWYEYVAPIPMTGNVYIIFEGISEWGNATYIDDITVEHIPSCGTPSISVNGTIATIEPDDIGTPESFELQIGEETVSVNDATADLNTVFTLAPATAYSVRVRTNCGGDDYSEWSAWVDFVTPCEAITENDLPYHQGFESTNCPANCWSLYYGSTSSDNASVNQMIHTTDYMAEGSRSFRFSSYSSATDYNEYLISPELNVANLLLVSFKYANHGASDNIYFGYSTTDNNINSFIWTDALPNTGSSSNWTSYVSNLPTGVKYFAIKYYGNYAYYAYVDDLTIEIVPTCFVPANLTISDIQDNSAVVNWAVNSDNPDTVSYIVEYMAADEEAWLTATVNDLTYNLSDLTPSTTYLVRVKTDCGNDDESGYAETEFTTLCPHGYYEGTQVVCPEAEDLRATAINPFLTSCDVEGAVTIKVKNFGYEGAVSAFTAYYQINDQEVVSEEVALSTPLAFLEETTYAFQTMPAFESGVNYVSAWVVLGAEENPAVVYTTATVLEPETVPYVEDFWYVTVNEGWNNIDANNDGITMNLNNNINYTYNDELAADDWMMSPCIEMPAGVYTVSYKYAANSAMTESFEVYYGNGAHIADMTNALAAHTFNNTIAETVTHTITIAEDGVYNFGFHATSLAGNMGFSIENFEIYPVIDVEVIAGENGSVTPNGTVAVNYGQNMTLSLVPDPMYHVAGVWVDSVQVVPEDATGANFMLYTLENVTEPHTVFVDFKLEFHIIKTVENYRPDLYADFGGAFEPAATDTTINPDPFTVKMVADPHYFLNSLSMSMVTPNDMQDVTLDVVDNGDGTYNYTIDTLVVANYYLNAVFRRDTVAINYNVLTGKGYAHDSQLLDATDADNNSYTTWVDYSVNHDVDTTVTFHTDAPYHLVDVIVNGESQGRIDSYTFEDVTESQNVDIKFGYRIDAFVSNYNTYDSITDIMGTITPDTQYVAEYDPMLVIGTVEEHFHLYQFFVNGEDRISEVVFGSDPHYYYFTMDSIADNYTIEAVVKVDTFAITYNVLAGQGYADASGLLVEGDSYSTIVNYADNWYSNIEPATGYSIANVTLDGQNLYTANNYQFNYIEESHVFDVTFVANTYTVATNAYGNGTVSDDITFTYDPENAVDYEFTATPAEGYYIASVTINNEAMEITDVNNFTYTIENVADNYTINVIFQMYTYTMTATVNPTSTLEGDVYGGTITPSGTQTVNYGADVTYTINANEGWYIYYVTVDGVNTNYTQADGLNTLDVPFTNINDNHEVEVGFLRYKYDITAAIDGDVHGAINEFFTSLTEVVYYGENFSMTFDADNNYQVADVVIDGEDMGAITSYEFVNVTANHTVVVSFEAIMYTLTATSNTEGCTITPATTSVQAGSNVNYTLTVANGYHLENVIANGEEVVVTNNAFTISDVQSDYTIFANFASNYVTVTVDQPEHATITPGTQTFAYGATPSYMIVPEVGYDIVSVTAGNAVVNVTYNNGIGSFTLDPVHADITLTATTAKKQFTITVATPTNGVISPAATQTVEYGDNITFTITPNQYYTISDVIVDGSSRGQLSSYTFYNVTSNHSIAAEFESACYMPTNLTAFNIDTTSAELTWVGNAPSYEVRYKAADDAAYTVQTVNTNSVQLTGLTPGTLYAWGVRAICGSNLSSEWAINGFTTKNSLPSSISSTDMSSINVYSYLNNVYIVNEEGIAISNVDIYDIYGKQVYTGKVLNSPEVISLNVANGNYVVRLATENGVGVYKVVIVR
jgi:hypothetical protein